MMLERINSKLVEGRSKDHVKSSTGKPCQHFKTGALPDLHIHKYKIRPFPADGIDSCLYRILNRDDTDFREVNAQKPFQIVLRGDLILYDNYFQFRVHCYRCL